MDAWMDVWWRADCPLANFCTKRYDSRGIVLGCAASSGGSVSFSFLMMVRFTAVALALAASSAYALYHDEVGLNDFLISTGGHGRVTRSFFSSNGEIVLSGSPNHSCYVSARDVLTGALLWRMNGCSDGGRSSSSSVQSISLSNDGQVLVLHDGKILKGIDVVSGNLVIDEPYASAKSIEVMSDVKVPLSKIANGSKKGACKGTDSHFAVAISAPAKSDVVEVQVFQVKGDNFDLIKTDSLTSSILHKAVNGDIVDVFPSCGRAEMGSIEVLVTTSAGTSTMIQIPIMNQKLSSISKLWSHEEALATVISAVLLDNSPHVPVDEMVDVSFQDRLGLQLEGGKQFLSKILSRSGILDVVSDESDTFGFKKIAVALSQSTTSRSRLFGIDTLENGKIAWSLLLSEKSTKNVMFKDSNSPSTSHHSSEVLLISELNDGKTLEWSCVDGINGNILDKGSLKVSNFSKFFPIDTTSKAKHCRQVVLALDESGNASVIPTNDDALDAAASVVELNNFYLHSIDRESGIISSLLIEESQSNENANFMSSVVGKARISEKIVSVAYPLPDEVVQSPATIMGDDSLLLKYLNPHIAVIVSQGYQSDIETFESNPDDFAAAEIALKAAKKPQGVSQPGESSPVVAQSPPSLFITLVDTVSAKILYRVSHADASGHPDIGINEVPVVVSENWIVYTFWNHRTKRSELGVLTLYEGMIEKYGMTAFKSPVQEKMFSSFESPSPVVLQKTYSVGKRVTSLGITQTTLGISLKNYLLGLENGQVFAVDRIWLDPRRPSSEPTEAERMERLGRYSPNIPLFPQKAVSYDNMVEGVTFIISASTNLESQSLMLAYGGPDIFFSRIAPSKGFDLLPDSFNRQFLLVVVFGLIGVTRWLNDKNKTASLNLGWS